MRKKGEILNQVIIHVILIAFIFALFLMATAEKINGRGVKQQVVEKQTALLIDSAVSGMSFEIPKYNDNGLITKLEIRNERIFATVDGLPGNKGYPFFSRYSVSVSDMGDKFIVRVQ
jgi:hypothetical protein